MREPGLFSDLPGRIRRRLRRARQNRARRRDERQSHARSRPSRRPDEPRTFDLALPTPPTSEGGGPRMVRISAPHTMYVPQRLEEVGLAGYEAETMSVFIAALQMSEQGTVYDIGANIGVFSIVAAALTNWRVVAFEPTPELAQVARRIIGEHGLACRVEQLALAAREGTATFYLSDVTDSSSSLREDFRPHHRSIDVELQTLDRYAAHHPPAPSVLKIDTESTEPDVLRGGMELLARERPWIICEVLAGRTEAELMSILRPLDYRWYHITDEARFGAVDEIVGDRTYAYMNWLFAPEPPSDQFWEIRARWFDALRRATPRGSRPG